MNGKPEQRISLNLVQNVNHILGIKMGKRIRIKFDLIINKEFVMNDFYTRELVCTSGIYCYFYRGNCLYVGATNDLYTRALRAIRREKSGGDLLDNIVSILNPYSVDLRIRYAEERFLREYEIHYFNKLKPFLSCGTCRPYKIIKKRRYDG